MQNAVKELRSHPECSFDGNYVHAIASYDGSYQQRSGKVAVDSAGTALQRLYPQTMERFCHMQGRQEVGAGGAVAPGPVKFLNKVISS